MLWNFTNFSLGSFTVNGHYLTTDEGTATLTIVTEPLTSDEDHCVGASLHHTGQYPPLVIMEAQVSSLPHIENKIHLQHSNS